MSVESVDEESDNEMLGQPKPKKKKMKEMFMLCACVCVSESRGVRLESGSILTVVVSLLVVGEEGEEGQKGGE